MQEGVNDRLFLLLRCLRRSASLTLRQVIVLPLNDHAFPLCLRDIQVCHMESRHVHLFRIELYSDLFTRYVSLGKKNNRPDMNSDGKTIY